MVAERQPHACRNKREEKETGGPVKGLSIPVVCKIQPDGRSQADIALKLLIDQLMIELRLNIQIEIWKRSVVLINDRIISIPYRDLLLDFHIHEGEIQIDECEERRDDIGRDEERATGSAEVVEGFTCIEPDTCLIEMRSLILRASIARCHH